MLSSRPGSGFQIDEQPTSRQRCSAKAISAISRWGLIWLGSYLVVRFVHVACFKAGWLSSPGSTTWENVFFCAVLPGLIAATDKLVRYEAQAFHCLQMKIEP